MAQGSIICRCRICGNLSNGACQHKGGRYAIAYPVQKWDARQGRVVKAQKWESVKGQKGKKANKKDAEALLSSRLVSIHEGTFRELQEITFADK